MVERFAFCEVFGRPGVKVKESASRMEMITSTTVLLNHADGEDTRFSTMSVPLVNNLLGNCFRVIIIGAHQAKFRIHRMGI